MEHSYIEEHDLVGRYLSGRLSDEELMRFEEHFLSCPQCAGQLETTEDIRSGLRTAAAAGIRLSQAYLRTAFMARVARLRRARRAIFLTTAALLIMPIAWLAWTWNNARRDLIQARQASSGWQRKYEETAQSARDLAEGAQAREKKLSAERDRLAAHVEREREARERLANRLKGAAGEQTVVPVFTLSMMRDLSPDLLNPVDEITLSSSSKSIILLLELEPDPNLLSYYAAVSTAGGRRVWRRDSLKPKSKDGLALSLNSSLLKPDTYLLTLEGLTTERRYKLIAKYTFRVFSR